MDRETLERLRFNESEVREALSGLTHVTCEDWYDTGYALGRARGWNDCLDEIKKLLEGTTMANVNPKKDRRFETVSKEGNTTIMRVASDKPQPKCYGDYLEITAPSESNVNAVLAVLRSALNCIFSLREDGLARKVESFTLVIKDETIGWKADIWGGEGK